MQTGIVVSEDSISGTLNYVTDYTGFNSTVVEEQSGNYIALKIETTPEDAVTTVEIVGGTKGPVQLDEDMMFIGRIKNKDTQSIRVVATTGDETTTKTYSLTGLTLKTE